MNFAFSSTLALYKKSEERTSLALLMCPHTLILTHFNGGHFQEECTFLPPVTQLFSR